MKMAVSNILWVGGAYFLANYPEKESPSYTSHLSCNSLNPTDAVGCGFDTIIVMGSWSLRLPVQSDSLPFSLSLLFLFFWISLKWTFRADLPYWRFRVSPGALPTLCCPSCAFLPALHHNLPSCSESSALSICPQWTWQTRPSVSLQQPLLSLKAVVLLQLHCWSIGWRLPVKADLVCMLFDPRL